MNKAVVIALLVMSLAAVAGYVSYQSNKAQEVELLMAQKEAETQQVQLELEAQREKTQSMIQPQAATTPTNNTSDTNNRELRRITESEFEAWDGLESEQ